MLFCLELIIVLYGFSMLADDWSRSRQRKIINRFLETKKEEFHNQQKAEIQEWKRKNGVPADFTML